MRSFTGLVALLGALTVAAPVAAQDDGDKEVRRDPKGQKGISPYNEELARGRKAFASGKHDEAIVFFKRAVDKDKDKMEAYFLIAQAHIAKDDRKAATDTINETGSKKGDEELMSRVLFFRADVLEREANTGTTTGSALKDALAGAWDKTKEAYTAYSVFLQSHTRVKGYAESSDERKKQIDERRAREKQFEDVIKRMADDKNTMAEKK